MAIVGVAYLWSSSGCSVAFTDGPPAAHATMPYFDCTSSNLAPNLDITMAGLFGLATLGASSDTQSSDTRQAEVTMVVMTAGLLASAVYGWKVTGACRDAKNALSVRLMNQPNGPAFRDAWMGNNQDVLRVPASAPLGPPSAGEPSNVSPPATTPTTTTTTTTTTTSAPPPRPAANAPSQKLRGPTSTPTPGSKP